MATRPPTSSEQPRGPSSESHADFLARGERAWQEYLRTGHAVPADQVFAPLDALLAARRAELTDGSDPPIGPR